MRVLVLSGTAATERRALLVKMLRAEGHQVCDPREGDVNAAWRKIDPDWEAWRSEDFIRALRGEMPDRREAWRREMLKPPATTAQPALTPGGSATQTLGRGAELLEAGGAGRKDLKRIVAAREAEAYARQFTYRENYAASAAQRMLAALTAADAIVIVTPADRTAVQALGIANGLALADENFVQSAWVLLMPEAKVTPELLLGHLPRRGAATSGVTTDAAEIGRALRQHERNASMSSFGGSPRVNRFERWQSFDDGLQFNAGWNQANYDGQRNDPDAPACWATQFVWATQVQSTGGPALSKLADMRAWLQARPINADGRRPLQSRYVSGTTVRDDTPHWTPEPTPPWTLMQPYALPDLWTVSDPHRFYWDVTNAAGRTAWIRDVLRTTLEQDWEAISIDNIYRGMNLGISIDRDAYDAGQLALLTELYAELEKGGRPLRVVVNVAANGSARLLDFLDVVDGLLFELPLHPNVIAGGAAAVAAELAVYRAVLDRGLLMGLVPIAEGLTTPQKIANQVTCAGAAMLIWKPEDALCVSMSDAAPASYDWFGWKETLGWPLGAYTNSGLVFTRQFVNATLTVDFANKTATVVES